MIDLTLDFRKATLISMPLVLGLLGLVMAPYVLLWGTSPLLHGLRAMNKVLLAAILILGTFIHELVHACTWILAGRLRGADVSLGINWRAMAPFAHLKVPISTRPYRLGTAMPGILMGVIPAAGGLLSGSPFWTLMGAIFTALAAGDVMILFLLIGVRPEALVQDHPTRMGCSIIEPAP